MKRVVSTLIILILTIILCVVSLHFLENTTKSVIEDVNLVKEYLEEEKNDLALSKATSAAEKWQQNKKILKIFIDHSHLDEIDVDFAELRSNINNNEASESLAISENIIVRATELKRAEEPILENIL